MAENETNAEAAAQLGKSAEKEFLNGWHFTINHLLTGLGSACAMIGLDIKEELTSLTKKVEARFAKK